MNATDTLIAALEDEVAALQDENDRLQKRLDEAIELLMAGERLRSQVMMELIMMEMRP